jgi:hypothetical protein
VSGFRIGGLKAGGFITPTPPPGTPLSGPTLGITATRNNTGPRGAVSLASAPDDAQDWTSLSHTDILTTDTSSAAQTKIDNDVTGRIWFAPGIYRWTSQVTFRANKKYRLARPAKGVTKTSSNTAFIRGSREVSSAGWTNHGNGTWSLGGQTQDFSAQSSTILAVAQNSNYPPAYQELEDFWSDGNWLWAQTNAAAVANSTNKKFMDRVNDRVYIGFDPTGHLIEALAHSGTLIFVNGSGVRVQGGVVEHALIRACRTGPPSGAQISDVHILDVEFGYGHLQALKTDGDGVDVVNHVRPLTLSEVGYCRVHHGGKYAHGEANVDGLHFHHNEIHHGNFLHFGHGTLAEGTTHPHDEGANKSLYTMNSTYEHNWYHDNDGANWFDFGSHGNVVQENVYQDMWGFGSFWEANPGPATYRRNAYIRCGRQTAWPDPVPYTSYGINGGGILVSSSPMVEVDRCRFVDCGQQPIYVLTHDNDPSTNVARWNGHAYDISRDLWVHHCQVWHKHVDGQSPTGGTLEATGYGAIVSARNSQNVEYLASANNKWDFNEYHTPPTGRGGNGVHAWFFWPSGQMKTFAQWRAGLIFPQAPASYYDPNSTWVADYTTDPADT